MDVNVSVEITEKQPNNWRFPWRSLRDRNFPPLVPASFSPALFTDARLLVRLVNSPDAGWPPLALRHARFTR